MYLCAEVVFSAAKELPDLSWAMFVSTAKYISENEDKLRKIVAGRAKGKRPSLVFFNGYDVTKEVLYLMGLGEQAARGISVLLCDQPGSGGPYVGLLDGWGGATAASIQPPYNCTDPALAGIAADNDGFQEWQTRGGSQPTVPEPASLLLGSGLSAGLAAHRRRARAQTAKKA